MINGVKVMIVVRSALVEAVFYLLEKPGARRLAIIMRKLVLPQGRNVVLKLVNLLLKMQLIGLTMH